jgi:hypothetical protein
MLTALLAVPTEAQQTSPSPTNLTPQELAKRVHNPFEDFVKVPVEAAIGFNFGSNHSAGVDVNLQPVIPFALNAQWDLIARPNLMVAYLPSPNSRFGLSDIQTPFYLTPRNANKWIWGVGPIFQFPTASSTDLGSGKWCVGPTGAVIYSNGP